ncbi:gamma-glutamyl-gamma-aminobutyrate hydrolase family protein [Alphaproteobacteria bacterium LSUCC0684]
MKVVAVSQRVDSFSDRNETRDALDQRLIEWLTRCGYVPVPVPNGLGDSIRGWLMTLRPSALVLSGGNDIGQYPERDETELALLSYAKELTLPVLGICRGMQMMAHWAGATFHRVSGHVRTRHQLSGEISTEVNSYHNYSLTDCPSDFEVMARSEDGEIEAIRHRVLPWEGWMWHPEREDHFVADDNYRIKALFGG